MAHVFAKNSKVQRTPTKYQSITPSPTIMSSVTDLSPKKLVPLTPQLLPKNSEVFMPTPSTSLGQPSEQQEVVMNTTSNIPVEEGWTTTTKRGRGVSPTTPNQKCKQMKIHDYWLAAHPVSLSSRFANLPEKEEESILIIERKQIPPPIFVSGVETIQPLISLLKEVAPDAYDLKLIGVSQVKIQLKEAINYPVLVKALAERNTQFHSYQGKHDKTYKVVIRNLHPSINTEELKNELIKLGHEAVNIINIRQSGTKKPLPLFKVELKTKDNNKDVHAITRLLHSVVQVEKPHIKREVVQCTSCQRYGHTKTYCHRKPRCVKCAGEHPTNQCQRKEWGTEVKCVLCNGNHPANYKGCTVYKEVQTRRFPPLRQKIVPTEIPMNPKPNPSYQLASGLTYAQKLQEPITNEDTRNKDPKENSQTPISFNNEQQQESSSTNRLEVMMEKLMTKMDTILNLLTTIVSNTFNVQNP